MFAESFDETQWVRLINQLMRDCEILSSEHLCLVSTVSAAAASLGFFLSALLQ